MFIKSILGHSPQGMVPDTRQTDKNWQLHVSYFGNLSVTGTLSSVDFSFPLGVNIEEALALEVDGEGIGTIHGAITRYREAPDTLRFIIHHYTLLIDRNKLVELASR